MAGASKLDIRNFDGETIISSSGAEYVWAPAEVAEKIYFVNVPISSGIVTTVPATVLKFPSACFMSKKSGDFSYQEALITVLLALDAPNIESFWQAADGDGGKNMVNAIYVGHPGSGYKSNPLVWISPPDYGGIRAEAISILNNGRLQSIRITNNGKGYSQIPTVKLFGGDPDEQAEISGVRIVRLPVPYCGLPSGDGFGEANNNVDGSAANTFSFTSAYMPPAGAVIPLKSNIRTYGPYISLNFNSGLGGIEAETDTDLAPWVFGSINAMDVAGINRANQFETEPLIISEIGSVSLVGFPSYSFGAQLNDVGPYLNSLNLTFGPQGVTTRLDFQTFTEKYGSLPRYYREQIKNVTQNKQKQLKLIRNQAVEFEKGFRKAAQTFGTTAWQVVARNNRLEHGRRSSLGRILVSEMYDHARLLQINEPNRLSESTGQRIITGIENLGDCIQELRYDYNRKAYMSLDSIYSPVSISGGLPNHEAVQISGYKYLPRYYRGELTIKASDLYPEPTEYPFDYVDIIKNKKTLSGPLHAQPPAGTGNCESGGANDTSFVFERSLYNVEIKNMYLNPLANPYSIPHHSGSCAGHSLDYIGRGTGVPESGMLMSLVDETKPNKYFEDYRFLGLRGPLVLHSWGYDIDGKPIPNFVDNEKLAKSGLYVHTITDEEDKPVSGLTDYFMEDWLQKPATWPVGPIDLRFDRNRGVWVAPQPYKIVLAEIIANASGDGYSSYIGNVIETKEFTTSLMFDKDGKYIAKSGCYQDPLSFREDYERLYDYLTKNWVLTSVGGPCVSGSSSGVEVVDCISINGDLLEATRKTITFPPGTTIEDAGSCAIPLTECETPTETPTDTPTEPPTPTPTSCVAPAPGYPVDVESECYKQVIENDPYCCQYWDLICQLAYNDCEPTPTPTPTPSPLPTVWFRNCCDSYKPLWVKVTEWAEDVPEEGDVFSLGSGCFTVLGNVEALERYTPLGSTATEIDYATITATPYDDCKVCTSGENIEPCGGSGSGHVLIDIIDPIKTGYQIGDLIYAYYDTENGKYIPLTGNPREQVTVYGDIYPDPYNTRGADLVVKGVSTNNTPLIIGDRISFLNPLEFNIPISGEVCAINGIAQKFYKVFV
jgi:hypothetical protein